MDTQGTLRSPDPNPRPHKHGQNFWHDCPHTALRFLLHPLGAWPLPSLSNCPSGHFPLASLQHKLPAALPALSRTLLLPSGPQMCKAPRLPQLSSRHTTTPLIHSPLHSQPGPFSQRPHPAAHPEARQHNPHHSGLAQPRLLSRPSALPTVSSLMPSPSSSASL